MTTNDGPLLQSVRVRARGERGGRSTIAAGVERALHEASWPEAPRDEVIVLRRLSVRGRLRDLPRLVGRELAAALQGGAAERTRFATTEQMVAALAVAIVRGEATRSPWRALLPDPAAAPSDALRRLFVDQAARLPGVMEALVERREAAAVLRALTEAAAGDVAAAVEIATGAARPRARDVEVAIAIAREAGETTTLHERARWAPPFGGALTLPGLASDDARVELVVLLDAITTRPRALQRAAQVDVAAGFAHACAVVAGREPPEARPSTPAAARRFGPAESSESPTRDATRVAPLARAESDDRVAAATRAAPRDATATEPPSASRDAAEDDALVIVSRWCGLFRLLPFLLQRDAQAWLAGCAWWQAGGSGFALLLELALALGLADDDEATQWLALTAAEVDPPAAPLPPLDVAPLIALGVARYGAELFSASLLRARGRLLVRCSRIDVVLPGGELRLDVRLAGLDVDPGFVPWLGRVVRFHYELGSGALR